MNFLAHSLFGFGNSELIAGQFCGDFVRGSDLSRFPRDIERGIRLHRYLDRFTDTHLALVPVRKSMPLVPRRFAGIVVDVMFDHYLARNWGDISELSLDAHAQEVHAALNLHKASLPDSLKRFMVFMHKEEILQQNVQLSSIEVTLRRIASRSDKLSSIALKQTQLEPLRESLNEPFDRFLPDLNTAATTFVNEQIDVSSSGNPTTQL